MSAATASKLAALRALTAAPSAPITIAAPVATVAPAIPFETTDGSVVDIAQPSGTSVKAGTVKTVKLSVDGFELSFSKGTLDDKLVKAATGRATTNVWYPIVEWIAGQPTGFLTIRKLDGVKATSPVSKLDSAITRFRKLGGVNAGKLDTRSGTEKGTWFLIKRA